MVQCNRFIIHNDLSQGLVLNIEPEGAFFALAKGQEVSVTEAFTSAPVTIKVSMSERGEPIVSIWPGDGEVHVEQDGVDVFELIQRESASDSVGRAAQLRQIAKRLD